MTSIFKVAKRFEQKLIFASASNYNLLKSVYDSAMAVVRLKPLWLASAGDDIYEESTVEQKINNINSIARQAWAQVQDYGMPFAGQRGYGGFINNMAAAAQAFFDVKFAKPLDPSASSSLQRLKSAVNTARNNAVPIGIPAINKPEHVEFPVDSIKGKPPSTQQGSVYPGQEEEENMSYMPFAPYR